MKLSSKKVIPSISNELENAEETKRAIEDENQGIPKNDLLALLEYVANHNFILMIRPVEPLTRSLHESANFPTKDLKIKGKSASWGPWAGFIPIEQGLSKLVGSNEKIIKSNQEVQESIKNRQAVAVPLQLTQTRLYELHDKKVISILKEPKEPGYITLECLRPDTKEKVRLTAQEQNNQNNSETEYRIFMEKKEPVLVLAHPSLKRPFIADYDLFAVVTPWATYGQEKVPINPDVTYEAFIQRRPKNETSKESYYDQEHSTLGNVPPYMESLVKDLNEKALKRKPYLECFHHGADVHSRYSVPEANYPLTVIMPKFQGAPPHIRLIKTEKELSHFLTNIHWDYRIESNPLWEPSVRFAANATIYSKVVTFTHPETLSEVVKNILIKVGFDTSLLDSLLIDEITEALISLKKTFKERFDPRFFFETVHFFLSINSSFLTRYNKMIHSLLAKKLLTNEIYQSLFKIFILLKMNHVAFVQIQEFLIRRSILTHTMMLSLHSIVKDNLSEKNELNNIKFQRALAKFEEILSKEEEGRLHSKDNYSKPRF